MKGEITQFAENEQLMNLAATCGQIGQQAVARLSEPTLESITSIPWGRLRNRNSLELLGIWEQLHNPDFNPVEFDGVKKQSGLNSFTLTPKRWIKKTAAIDLQSKAGRYGGAYANEADLLNVALFSCTAKEWREENPKLKENIRDHSTSEQFLVS